uniref:C-type lectin domain-containing protein n=1 Tax=Acrobeloides nanus TaxID=290746 RepID=A0A914EDC6_9BILA
MNNFWLGATNLAYEGQWMWSDGSNLNMENWQIDQPSGPNKCLIADSLNGIWLSQECHVHAPYVCKVVLKNENQNRFVYPCPEGWIYGEPTNKCYKFINLTANYTTLGEVTKLCEQYDPDASLISIHSYVENNLVSSFQFWKLGYWAIWLGLYCEDHACTWTDGTKYDFSLWEGGESPYEWDGCVIMTGAQGDHYRQKWEVTECAFQAGFWHLACQTNAKNTKKLKLL